MARWIIPVAGLLVLAWLWGRGAGKGGDFYALQAAGISYQAPAKWKVLDPPTSNDLSPISLKKVRAGILLGFIQHNIAVGAFHPGADSLIVVACQGPHKPYDGSNPNPLQHLAEKEWVEGWWRELPLICDRKEGTVSLADGTKLSYRQARMKPGLVTGDDVIHGIAWGKLKGRYLVIAGGMKRVDDSTAGTLEANIKNLVERLTVQGDDAPSAILTP